jgi:hypothetical protein
MRFLLDDELLSGTHDVVTSLRPQRAVRRVDEGDASAVTQMMTYLCQVWGGQAHPIIPSADLRVPAPYLRCLHREQYDIVDRRGSEEPELDLPERIRQEPAWDYPAVLVVAHRRREMLRTVEVAELEPGDPWAPIYAATLGTLPRKLDAGLREFAGLREGFLLEEVVPVQYAQVTGSPEDLVGRLLRTEVLSPRQWRARR